MYFPDITNEYNLESDDADDCMSLAKDAIFEKFNISAPLHVHANGFDTGAASAAEIAKLVEQFGAGWRETLNHELEIAYRAQMENLELENARFADAEREIDEAHYAIIDEIFNI